MPRPKPSIYFYLKKIINEEIFKFSINEVLDHQETDYEIVDCSVDHEYVCQAYRFKSKSGNSYDVQFFKIMFDINQYDFLKGEEREAFAKKFGVYKVIVGFSLTDRAENYDDTVATMDDPYIKRTNYWEQYEVLGKIIFLIQEYIKNNPDIKMYSYLKNTFNRNISTYNLIYEKAFKNQFNKYEFEKEFLFLKQH